MGILDRVAKLLEASVSDLMERERDAESLLNQALREMERELQQARGQHEDARHAASLKRQLMLRRQEEAALFAKRAEEARAEGRPLAAEEQERFRQKALSGAQALETEAREAERKVAEFQSQSDELERAGKDLRAKVEALAERLRQVRVNAPRNAPGLGEKPPPEDTYQRAREKVEEREARAEPGWTSSTPKGGTEWELERLQRQAAVDEKLAELKRKMQGGG
ncbi:MAG: PspA/IM30 family protein [Myxococcota bacterium]